MKQIYILKSNVPTKTNFLIRKEISLLHKIRLSWTETRDLKTELYILRAAAFTHTSCPSFQSSQEANLMLQQTKELKKQKEELPSFDSAPPKYVSLLQNQHVPVKALPDQPQKFGLRQWQTNSAKR